MYSTQLEINFEVTVEVDKASLSQEEANKRYLDLLEETYAKDDEDEPWWNWQ